MYKYCLNVYACIQYVAYTFYRDIKPDNFLVGLNSSHSEGKEDKSSTIYMVDLGLVKPYTDDETGRHIPYAENRSICGTLRYIGLNVHMVIIFSACWLYASEIFIKNYMLWGNYKELIPF